MIPRKHRSRRWGMTERVAEAMNRAQCLYQDGAPDDEPSRRHEAAPFSVLAEAAVRAMRHPTKKMCETVAARIVGGDFVITTEAVKWVWTEMVKEAMK